VSTRSPSEGQTNCYPVQSPVLVVHSTNNPAVFKVVAFTFDVHNTPVVVPMTAVEKRIRSSKKVHSTASTWLKFFEGLLLLDVKKAVGNITVKVSEVKSVFGPLCNTAYIVLRVTGTPEVRATAEPVMVTSSHDQASQYVSTVVVSSLRSRATATSYTTVQAPVQFFLTPDQVSSYMNAIIRSG
jgi:hypothetical protein